jgi:hypothetical protein
VAKLSSEKAWVDKHVPTFKSKKLTFLEFTRYYRWYCIDSRSEILRRIHPIKPWQYFNNNYYYPSWPRLVV